MHAHTKFSKRNDGGLRDFVLLCFYFPIETSHAACRYDLLLTTTGCPVEAGEDSLHAKWAHFMTAEVTELKEGSASSTGCQ